MDKYTPLRVEFSLKDVGSEIIDQLSTDVYTGAGSIIRELVKNAYDSYLALDDDDFDSTCQRQIVISREREGSLGRIWIADSGIGQDLKAIKGNTQISISTKPNDLDDATGFRGLGSWAVLGAGSRISIHSSKKDSPDEYCLAINVREIYKLLNPNTTLHDILNNPKCITFSIRQCDKARHFTTVEILCDGPAENVNGHELNRLYQYTDPQDSNLRDLIVEHCPIPFVNEAGHYQEIYKIYKQAKYFPTALVLDGEHIERRIPAELSEFTSHPIPLAQGIGAIAWIAENPDATGEVSGAIDEQKHALGGGSIQLMKYNVPIGSKGMFSNNVRSNILEWYVGEVHILATDVLPNANGQDLRAGTVRELFIQALQGFYKGIEKRAESKSERISLLRKLNQGLEAAEKLKEGRLTRGDKAREESKIATAVEIIDDLSKKRKGATLAEQKLREAAKDEKVIEARKRAKKMIEKAGLYQQFKPGARPTPPPVAEKNNKTKNKQMPAESDSSHISVADFQSRVGRAIPKFQALGLDQKQLDGVLQIIRSIFNGK